MNHPMANRSIQDKTGKGRRRHTRYTFPVTLRYRTLTPDSVSSWKTGRTLNMGAGGILITGEEVLSPGSTVELMLDWPGFVRGGTARIQLSVIGEVLRNVDGAALRIVHHEFRSASRLSESSCGDAASIKLHGTFTAA